MFMFVLTEVIVLVNGCHVQVIFHRKIERKQNFCLEMKAIKCFFSFLLCGKNMSKNIYRIPNGKFPQGYQIMCLCVAVTGEKCGVNGWSELNTHLSVGVP